MADQPDLPGLERVTSRGVMSNSPAWLIVGGIAALLVFIVGVYLACFHRQKLPILTWVMALIVSSLVVQAVSDWVLLSFQWSWRTDAEGIRASGLFGSRSMCWTEVERAETRRTGPIRGTRLVLSGGGREFLVPLRDTVLVASVWQHLRRVGKSSDVSLPAVAETWWRAVPDDVPTEISLDVVPQPSLPASLFAPVVATCTVALLAVVAAFGGGPGGKEGWLWLLLIVPLFVLKAPEPFVARAARHVNVLEDRLEADTLFGGFSARWSDIRRVLWTSQQKLSGTQHLLQVDTGPLRALRIPWAPEDEHSVKLVLAVVRQARTANPHLLVSIPNEVPLKHALSARG